MEYIQCTPDGIAEVYPKIYREVFGEEYRVLPHNLIVTGSLKDPIGYMCGFWMSENKFYIQDAGVLPKHRNKGLLRQFHHIVESIKGCKLYTMTSNQNVISMKTLLSSGFKPVGSRIGEDSVFYIDWMKEA